MKIVIFGANGHTGRLLARQTLDAGHAHYLLTLAQQGPQATVTISTVTDTPTLWEIVRREAFPQPKNAAASS
jgi:short subunit dehydrogenase-like uncharacterized protein